MTGATGNNIQSVADELPEMLCAALRRTGLAASDQSLRGIPMDGGVSSDIWRVSLPGGDVCIKRALPKLKVKADWQVPVERNAFEAAWFRRVAGIAPESVPELLGEDRQAGAIVMRFLDPADYPVWKHRLRSGDIDVGFARNVGDVLGRIHAATADRADVAEQFRTDENFFAIRLEPYLVAAARVHPDRAPALHALAEVTANERRALVHGDVSPKNILVGKAPVFLDAECAWYGDPAFDLAFCLNHLLLKSIWLPAYRGRLLDAFGALCDGYFRQARFESRASLERRTACLLPGLMLARVDGKSPVEYLDREELRGPVRRFARDELLHPTSDLVALRRHWAERLAA